jgi:hypothetical protein
MATLTRILDQHLDNASSLIEIRCHRVFFSGVRLAELDSIDQRIIANLEGIVLAGRDGQTAAMNSLAEWNSGAEMFVCMMLCAMDESLPFSSVFDRIDQNNAWGFAEAFCWLSQSVRVRWCDYLGSTIEPVGQSLLKYGRSFTTNEQTEFTNVDSLFTFDQLLRMPLVSLSAAASHSEKFAEELAVLTNPSGATFDRLLNKAVKTTGNAQRLAALFLASVSTPDRGDELISTLVSDESTWRLAALCMGIVGEVRFFPWLLDRTSSPAIGKEAGEAFCMITGANPIYHQLVAEESLSKSDPELENNETESLDTDFGAGLEYLDSIKARSWWEQFKGQVGVTAGRCILGKPKTARYHMNCLKFGDQWQRRSSALTLLSIASTKSLFDVSAPYFVQAEILSTFER